MNLETPQGQEVLRIDRPYQVIHLNDWVHDAYLEDELRFSPQAARAVIPIAQERAWAHLHPSMPDPELVKTTVFARHYQVPLTHCYIVVEHANSLETDIEWGCPDLLAAEYSDSTFRLMSAVSIRVGALDVRLLVSSEVARWLHRKVLRWWPVESDRSL